MNGIGPTDLSEAARSVVENIVATCVGLSSAVAVAALWATPSPEPTARVAAAYAGASATFTGCLSGKAAELTAVGLATAAIKLAFDNPLGGQTGVMNKIIAGQVSIFDYFHTNLSQSWLLRYPFYSKKE
ncbi:hypothetical protein ACVPOD_000616 [Citrobacter freundii]